MSAISIVKQPSALPHCCKLCGGGANSKEWFVDTGSYEEFYGAIYYCNECFNYMATLAGYKYESGPTDVQYLASFSQSGGISVLEGNSEVDGESPDRTVSLDSREGEALESSDDERVDELRSDESVREFELNF